MAQARRASLTTKGERKLPPTKEQAMFFLHFSGSYIADSAPYEAVGPFKEAWEAEEMVC